MNDVSLTGILNDFQSPDKHHSSAKGTALVHVLNENSRDSIFFNVKYFIFVEIFLVHVFIDFFYLCFRWIQLWILISTVVLDSFYLLQYIK